MIPKSEVLSLINNGKRFLILAHINPDGDAIGSACALRDVLKAKGKEVWVGCEHQIPNSLAFLEVDWLTYDFHGQLHDIDCVITVDTPTAERVGSWITFLDKAPHVISIDHHPSNVGYADATWCEPEASSTGEMIYLLAEALQVPITRVIAQSLYLAITTDTGSFQYQNTHAATFRIVANLIETGIDIEHINELIYSTLRSQRIHLMKRFLNRVQFEDGGKIAWGYMTRQDLAEEDACYEDIEGFVDLIRKVAGVEIAFFAFQKTENETKFSLRAKGEAKVDTVAAHFGGGGHVKAAGCTVMKPALDAAVEIVTVIKKERYGYR